MKYQAFTIHIGIDQALCINYNYQNSVTFAACKLPHRSKGTMHNLDGHITKVSKMAATQPHALIYFWKK